MLNFQKIFGRFHCFSTVAKASFSNLLSTNERIQDSMRTESLAIIED